MPNCCWNSRAFRGNGIVLNDLSSMSLYYVNCFVVFLRQSLWAAYPVYAHFVVPDSQTKPRHKLIHIASEVP